MKFLHDINNLTSVSRAVLKAYTVIRSFQDKHLQHTLINPISQSSFLSLSAQEKKAFRGEKQFLLLLSHFWNFFFLSRDDIAFPTMKEIKSRIYLLTNEWQKLSL